MQLDVKWAVKPMCPCFPNVCVAMAEWVIFEVDYGIPIALKAPFFLVSALGEHLSPLKIVFQCQCHPERSLQGIEQVGALTVKQKYRPVDY